MPHDSQENSLNRHGGAQTVGVLRLALIRLRRHLRDAQHDRPERIYSKLNTPDVADWVYLIRAHLR